MPSADQMPAKLTYADLLRLPEDDFRHELIDGEHFVSASPIFRHQEISLRLSEALLQYLREHPTGRMAYAPVDVILSEFDVVVPDLLYISNERAGIIRDQVYGAPDLMVEILSPSTRKRDEEAKRRLYDRAGVREYWIVDPNRESIAIYRRTVENLARASDLSRQEGALLTTPLLPGFVLDLDRIFGHFGAGG